MKRGPLVDPDFLRTVPVSVLEEVLTDKERWAIQWRFQHDATIEEVGSFLGCGPSCAQKQIAMAIYKLGQYYNSSPKSGVGSVTASSEANLKRRKIC